MKTGTTFILTFLLTLMVGQVLGQIPIQDAIKLRNEINANGEWDDQDNTVTGILNQYLDTSVGDDVLSELQDYDDNPYLSKFLTSWTNAGGSPLKPEEFITNVGSFNVTTIADGLAKFLVARTKQELSVTFFQKFQEKIKELPQLEILFPTTYKNLEVIGEEIYLFSAYLELLKEGFQKDMKNLLTNVQRLVDDKSMGEVFSQYPELKTIISDGLSIAIYLKNGDHAGVALDKYVSHKLSKTNMDNIDPNIYPSLVLLNIISQSVKATNDDNYWVGLKDIKSLKDETTLRIYLGLIYQQIKNFQDNNHTLELAGKNVLDILKDGETNYSDFKNKIQPLIQEVIEKGNQVDQSFNALKKAIEDTENKPDYQHHFEVLSASLNFIEHMGKIYQDLSGNQPSENLKLFISTTRSFGEIYVDLHQKQFVSAISEFASVYDNVILKRYRSKSEYYTNINKVIKDATNDVAAVKKAIEDFDKTKTDFFNTSEAFYNKISTLTSIKSIKEELKTVTAHDQALQEKVDQLIKFYIKYGNFIAVVAKAENSDQVQQAIEAIALPAGSASIKKNSKLNVSLNAYTGLFYGNEYLQNPDEGWGEIYGLSAPVGVAVSWPVKLPCKKFEVFSSFSIYGSLIDVGALASYRFTSDDTDNTETETLPEVTLSNILAPGLYGVLGFKNVPISLGYGWQQGPALREVNIPDPNNPGEFINETANGYRWSVFIAVDIPLINFYTKSR